MEVAAPTSRPDGILPRYAFWLSADIWPDILELIFEGGDDWLLDEEYAAG
jgi:hypothetical protein